MIIKKPNSYYENKHNIKYPNFIIKCIKREHNYIYFETAFGLCKKVTSTFGRSNYNINSALNKTKYLQKQLKYKYGNLFDYSLVVYLNNLNANINLVCKQHGIFKIKIHSVLNRKGNCPICYNQKPHNRKNIKSFTQKANLIHNYKYNYSKTIYSGSVNYLEIFCKEHGNFKQTASAHLQGYGCKKCANLKNSIRNADKPNLWTYKGWEQSAKTSNLYDSFKVYIIECWNEEEHFYKIGKTYLDIKYRFESKRSMPYHWKVLKLFVNNAEKISNLENKLKNENKENKYLPKIKFGGKRECFTKIKNL